MPTASPITQKHNPYWAWIWFAYTGFLFIDPIFEPTLFRWSVTFASFAVFACIYALYVRAFDNFNCRRVAEYGEADIERLMTTDGIIHSRSKIEGTIKNARTLIALEAEFGSLRAYHNSFATYDDARKDAKQRFAFMGDLNTYYWRFRTGASVPDFEEWMKGQERDHPRMREMVTLGASRLGAGRSLMR